MTGIKSLLSDHGEFISLRKIITANKSKQGFGSGILKFKNGENIGLLKEVLYVEGLPINIFSVDKVMFEGKNVLFDGKSQEISIFSETGEPIMKGMRIPGSLRGFILEPRIEERYMGVSAEEWHHRFAHSSESYDLLKNNLVHGITISNKKNNCCPDCLQSKICRSHHPTRTTSMASKNHLVLHFDTAGPMQKANLGDSKYSLLVIEEWSCFRFCAFVHGKDVRIRMRA